MNWYTFLIDIGIDEIYVFVHAPKFIPATRAIMQKYPNDEIISFHKTRPDIITLIEANPNGYTIIRL